MSYCQRCKKHYLKEENPQLTLMADIQSHWCSEYLILDAAGEPIETRWGDDPEVVAMDYSQENNPREMEYTETVTLKSLAENKIIRVEVEAEKVIEYSAHIMEGV